MTTRLIIDNVPPSLNKVAQQNWRVWHKNKKFWQGILEQYLLVARLPRPMSTCRVKCSLRFPQRRRRDEGNFRALLEKSLGDALVNGGWLVDDTPEHYSFLELTFEAEPGPKRTTLTLEWEA